MPVTYKMTTPLCRAAVGGQTDTDPECLFRSMAVTLMSGVLKEEHYCTIALVRKGHLYLVKILLDEIGPYLMFQVDSNGNTALHVASMFGYVNLVKHILVHYKALAFVSCNRNGNSTVAMDEANNFITKELQFLVLLVRKNNYDSSQTMKRLQALSPYKNYYNVH